MDIPAFSCPVDCTPPLLEVEFSPECPGAGLISGFITWALILPVDEEIPADPEDAASWSTLLADMAVLRGMGAFPESEGDSIELYNAEDFERRQTRTVTFDVTELGTQNYTTLQSWGCGFAGRVIVGSDDSLFDLGIASVKANLSSDGGRADIFTAHLEFKQEGMGIAFPRRFDNPMLTGV